MKKSFSAVIYMLLALIVLVMLGDCLYIAFGGLWLKGLTSFGFALLGATCLWLGKKLTTANVKFGIIMVVGLVVAMVADVVLNLHFITGAALFALGHIFYFASYCVLQKFRWQDIIYGAVIFVPSVLFITLAPMFDFGGVLMEIVCVIYAIIISCMVGKAISNFVKVKNLTNLILMLGSIFFFISDLMLLLNVFGNLPRVVDILCLATYYPAQIALAVSILNSGITFDKDLGSPANAKQENA